MDHAEHPLDRCSIGWREPLGALGPPSAERSNSNRPGSGGQIDDRCGVDLDSERIEQVSDLGRLCCEASDQHDDITSRHVVEQGKHFMTHAHPVEAAIGVGRINQWSDPEVGTQRPGLESTESEERMLGRTHGRQTHGTGAPEEAKQHRLGLIVGGVTPQGPGTSDPVALGPSAGFEIATVSDVHTVRLEPGPPVSCEAGDHVGIG